MAGQGVEKLRERMGAPEAPPRVVPDYRLHEQAVTLTRPKKVRITSKTLREDVAKRLKKAGLVLETPSVFPVKAKVNLTEAIEQGTQIAFEKESVVRLDHLLGRNCPARAGGRANERWLNNSAMIASSLIRRMDGHEVVTTRQILGEEKTLLTSVIMGMGQREPLVKDYVPPADLIATPQRIDELVQDASRVSN
jgi:hypothetical protein